MKKPNFLFVLLALLYTNSMSAQTLSLSTDTVKVQSTVCGEVLTPQFTIENTGASDLEYEIQQIDNLEQNLKKLNVNYSTVTDVIPEKYNFSDGISGTNISDGGGDMYDSGNYLNTNIATSISYSDNTIIESASFGPNGRYVTKKYDGLFVLAAELDGISDFYISGNLGADGNGYADTAILKVQVRGVNYLGFVKRVYESNDPSINHLIIIREDANVSRTYNTSTYNELHTLSNLENVDRLYYLLYAGTSSNYIDNTATTKIMKKFIRGLDLGGLSITPQMGTVLAGSSETISVQLDATYEPVGTFEMELLIESNDPLNLLDTIVCEFTVNGLPVFEVSETDFQFGELFEGASLTNTLVLYNSGCDTLKVSGINSSLVDYSTDLNSFNVLPYDSTEVIVAFSPTIVGNLNGTLTISTNDGDSVISLSGIGIPVPVLSVSTDTIFTLLSACEGVNLESFTIENSGYDSLKVVLNESASWLSASLYNDTLLTAETVNIELNFDASGLESDEYTTELIIIGNDPTNSADTVVCVFTIDGEPVIETNTTELNYGDLFVNGTLTETIQITNSGCDTLKISDISSPFSEYTFSQNIFNVLPFSSEEVVVTFAPTTVANFNTSITISNNDSDSIITVIGAGVLSPTMFVAGDTLKAQSTACGEILTQQFIIENTGDANLDYEIYTDGLDRNLVEFNDNYSIITDVIPEKYSFSDGTSGTNISDGGGDMYDNGNYLNTNIANSIPYSDNTIIESASFGTNGRYFTKKYDGLFVLAAELDSISTFAIGGGLGADGGGYVDATVLSVSVDGVNYMGFVKRVYGVSEPSVNHLIIIPEDANASHTHHSNTNYDTHTLSNIENVTQLYYILYAGTSGYYIDDVVTTEIMKKSIKAFGLGGLSTTPQVGTILAGSSETISVELDAANVAAGDFETKILVKSNDPLNILDTVVCEFTVNGLPAIEVSESDIQFNNLYLGATLTDTLVLYNSGCDTLQVSDILSTIPEFSVDTSVFNIPPFDSMLIEVTFAPLSAVTFNGTLTISTNDADSVVSLSGIGVEAPTLNVSTDTILSMLSVCEGFQLETFTIENTGGDSLKVLVNETANWLSASVYSDTLLTAETVNVELNFDAAGLESGEYSTEVIIEGNDLVNTADTIVCVFTVDGDPFIVSNKSELNFGDLFANGSLSDTIQINNTGCDTLKISDITTPIGYMVDTLILDILPFDSSYVIVTFTPTALGAHNGALTIVNNDTEVVVSLTGNSVAGPELLINSHNLTGTVSSCEATLVEQFTVQNTGVADLEVNASFSTTTILISEIFLGDPDFIEIMNVSNYPIDVNGWTVAVSQDYVDINNVNSVTWDLSGIIESGEVLMREDATGSNYWGNNIYWSESGKVWALIIDDEGNIVDYVPFAWGEADIQAMNVNVNGFDIQIGENWIGDGLENICGGTSAFARKSSADNNLSSDFECDSPSAGLLNDNFIYENTFGSNSSYFSLLQTEGVIPQSGSMVFEVEFSALGLESGVYEEVVFITSNDPLVLNDTVFCEFTVVDGSIISTDKTEIDFGDVRIGNQVSEFVQIKNTGCDTLFITDITSSSAEFTVSQSVFEVQPLDSVEFEITFAPLLESVNSEIITIASSGGDSVITVSGTGAVLRVYDVSTSNASGYYNYGDVINLLVHVNDTVSIDTTNGVPQIELNTTPISYAYYTDGDNTNSLIFSYEVGITDSVDILDYTSTTALSLNGATIMADGEDAQITLPAVGVFSKDHNITIDNIMPSVVLSTTSSDPTEELPIVVLVDFSEGVIDFTAQDLVVTKGTVSDFTEVLGGKQFTFNLNPTSDGAISVDLPQGVASDSAGNANLAASQLSLVYDGSAPSANISSSEDTSSNKSVIPVVVTFSEVITGFEVSDLSATNGTISDFTESSAGLVYEVNLNPTAQGDVVLTLAANSVLDAFSKTNAESSLTVSYDSESPTVSISTTSTDPTDVSPIIFVVDFSEKVIDFTSIDLVVTNGTVSNFSEVISGTQFSFDLTPIVNGIVEVSIEANVATDYVGNGNLAATPYSLSYTNTVSTTDVAESNKFQVYPNPNNGIFSVNMYNSDIQDGSICVRSLSGKELILCDLTEVEQTVDASALSQGIYIVQVKLGDEIFVRKIVIE